MDGNASDLTEIRSRTAALLAAVNGSDVDGVLDVWARDGTLMPPHHPAVRGHAALREYFGELFSRSRFIFAFPSSEIHLAGDTAFEQLTYTVVGQSVSGGSPFEDVGKGIHVYRRQSDGSWKLACDVWNSDRFPLNR